MGDFIKSNWIWILTAFLLGAAFFLLKLLTFGAVAFVNDVPAAAAQLIGSLLVLTAIVERSLSAINNAVFGQRKKQLYEQSFLRDPSNKLPTNEAVTARASLAVIWGKEETNRLAIGFLVAVLISGAGVRTLEALLQIEALGGTQRDLARFLDIILTAGLITGGSNGLAELLRLIKEGMTKPTP